MKKFFIMLCLTSVMTSNDITNKPTMNILELESSKVLSNFQGNRSFIPIFHKVYKILREVEIRQISDNSFEVVI